MKPKPAFTHTFTAGRKGTALAITALATPARPDVKPAAFAPDPQRRGLLAKVHLGKKELGLDDDDYRAMMARETGATSAADCSKPQLERLVAAMKRAGWVPALKGGRIAAPKAASHPSAKKARALWLSLGLLGVIRDPSERGLEAFARRQLGVEKLAWSDQAKVYKLIEAIKAIAVRHGWDQSVKGLAAPIWTLKLRLCEAQRRRMIALGLIDVRITFSMLVADILGRRDIVLEMTERDLEQLSAVLGQRIAAAPAPGPHEDA